MRISFASFVALFLLLLAADARAELDCWVPNREESHADGNLPFRSPQLTPFRDALLAAEQVVRDNPHFKAMPRKIHGTDPHRVRLISVVVSVVPNDEVPARRETMQKTKDTLDYARLAGLLR